MFNPNKYTYNIMQNEGDGWKTVETKDLYQEAFVKMRMLQSNGIGKFKIKRVEVKSGYTVFTE